MRAFADLFGGLDETTKTNEKVRLLVRYFSSVPAADAAWAIYFLSGRKLKQVVPTRKLAGWAIEMAGVPDWLFEESYHAVGDLAETIALLLPDAEQSSDVPLHVWVEQKLLTLREADEACQLAGIREAWLAIETWA